MRLRMCLAFAAAVVVISSVAAAQQPSGPPPIKSPELSADRHVTFRLSAPKATDVKVTCECLKDAVAMSKDDKGIWSATVGPIAPDVYEYEFAIDGVTVIDPRNEKVKYNSRPSVISSLLEVPGDRPLFYDVKPVPHGTVAIRWYPSKATNGTRRMYVYTPPNYDRDSSRLPVLYLLHGADGDDSAWTMFGRANQILDNLLADRKAAPMVVVMPFGYAYPPVQGVGGDKQRADFEKDLLENIIPFVQANYRVYTDRDHRAIIGLSMGGGQALTIGLHHLDLFSRVAGFSAAVGRTDAGGPFADVVADPKKTNSQLKLLWIGCGDEDSLFKPNQDLSAFFKSKGIVHTFHPSDGAHTWINWRKYLAEVAPQLWPSGSATSATGR